MQILNFVLNSVNNLLTYDLLKNSPDLSPCDYFLFPKLKIAMKGAFYDNVPTIQAAVT